jgi:cell division septation protein DedD
LKISEQQEQNIKSIFPIVLFLALSSLWLGCSSSEEATDEKYITETTQNDTTFTDSVSIQKVEPKPVKKTENSNQQFSVQADTLDVRSKQKQKNTVQSSISVKSSVPKKFYTVEIGAFRLQSNVRRHQEQLTKRFKLPVRAFLDNTIKLTRVCVGNFSSKKSAGDFLKTIKEKYPNDYPDPWVSQLTK